MCEVSEKLWLFNHKRADFRLPNFGFKRSLLSLLKVFTVEIEKEIKTKVKEAKQEVKVTTDRETTAIKKEFNEKLVKFTNNFNERLSDIQSNGNTEQLRKHDMVNISILSTKYEKMHCKFEELSSNVELNHNTIMDIKTDNDDKVKSLTKRVQLLEDRPFVRSTHNEDQLVKLSSRGFSFESIQEKILARIEKLESNHKAKQNEEISFPTHRYSDKVILSSQVIQPIYDTPAAENSASRNMSTSSNDQSQTRIKSRFQNNPEIILLMDSNRKFLREHLLSPDRNKRLKIIPCSDLSELKENIEYLHEDLQVLYIHTGVNDLDLKPVH